MKDTRKLLQDMLDAIASIEFFVVPSYDAFLEDEKTQDAIMFNLIVMGEAANKISDEFQEKHPEIPWSSIIGTRNVIVHGYDQVKLQIVWDIIHKNLQPLKESLLKLV
ncbi:MAG: DUF86 domain-containing protein [Anaerolineaceae bacterium]|nr:DUF86 domain-containing protein [Anaerolineaceae bacterium]